jgi:hypothetical protein
LSQSSKAQDGSSLNRKSLNPSFIVLKTIHFQNYHFSPGFSNSGMVVQHLLYHPKVEGSSPAAAGTRRENGNNNTMQTLVHAKMNALSVQAEKEKKRERGNVHSPQISILNSILIHI